MDLTGVLLICGFFMIIAIPFIRIAYRNETRNIPNKVHWLSDHLQFGDEILYYKDATFIAFNLTHFTRKTNSQLSANKITLF